MQPGVLFFAFVVLSKVSFTENQGRQLTESVAVVIRPSDKIKFNDCLKPTMRVTFNDVRVKINGSHMVFQRVSITGLQLKFATTETLPLPATNILQCAKSAARLGLEGFQFIANCRGLRLGRGLLRCQTNTGPAAIYVRPDMLTDHTMVVPYDEAPYILDRDTFNEPVKLYMFSAFLGPDPFASVMYEVYPSDGAYPVSGSLLVLENGKMFTAVSLVLDWNTCLTDGAYGIPLFVKNDPDLNATLSTYFVNECGNTVSIPGDPNSVKVMHSHPGLGCAYYPSDIQGECVVTFKTEDSSQRIFIFDYLPTSNRDICNGINATLYGSTSEDAQPLTYDFCRPAIDEAPQSDTFVVDLFSQPTTNTFGFIIYFTPAF